MLLGRKEVELNNMAERSLSCVFGGGAKKEEGGQGGELEKEEREEKGKRSEHIE